MKPLILITPSFDDKERKIILSESYITAVSEAGGIPVVFGYDGFDVIERVSATLFTGGGDINPLLLGEEPSYCGAISPKRDLAELELCRRAYRKNMPILGVCRGMQVISAALGGEVCQDIYENLGAYIKHKQEAPVSLPTHSVYTQSGSLARRLYGERTEVNSFHHQSVSAAPKGFKITAKSADGIAEMMESEKGFCVGAQWHTEAMANRLGLFRAFVKSAEIYGGTE